MKKDLGPPKANFLRYSIFSFYLRVQFLHLFYLFLNFSFFLWKKLIKMSFYLILTQILLVRKNSEKSLKIFLSTLLYENLPLWVRVLGSEILGLGLIAGFHFWNFHKAYFIFAKHTQPF
jgi:hypothetical protein